METLSVTTPPALLAVPLDDAKRHLRVDLDFTDDDTAIESLIRAASDLVGVEADATLVETGYALTLDGFPGEGGGYWRRSIRQAGRGPDWLPRAGTAAVLLPRGPVVEVESVTYIDADGVERTLDPSHYYCRPGVQPARLAPSAGQSWPTSGDQPDCVVVRYIAGFTAVPPVLAHAVLLTVGHWYENREATSIGISINDLPRGVKSLINAAKAGGSYR